MSCAWNSRHFHGFVNLIKKVLTNLCSKIDSNKNESQDLKFFRFKQGAKVGTLGRQNERNSSYVRLAHMVFHVSLSKIKMFIFNIFFFGFKLYSEEQK